MKLWRRGLPRAEAGRLAALMARAFTERERGWNADELRGLSQQPGVIVAAAAEGFGMIRVAGGEAELLTLAVDPAARGRGVGRGLLDAMLDAAWADGAEQVALEVAETNRPARRLYDAAGFVTAGRRPGYSRRAGGGAEDALILLRTLP